MSLRERVIEYVTANPTAKAAEVAAACGTTAQAVYQIKSDAGLSKSRKVKAAKSKAKKVVAAKPKKDKATVVEADKVNPPHYKVGGIEVIDYIKAKLTPEEFRGYLKGNVLKYVSREGHKNGDTKDLEKANWYIGRYIEEGHNTIG